MAFIGAVINQPNLAQFENGMSSATGGEVTRLDFIHTFMVTNSPTNGNQSWTMNSPTGYTNNNLMTLINLGYGVYSAFNVSGAPAGWTNLLPGGSTNTAFLTRLNNIIEFCENANVNHPNGSAQRHYMCFHTEPERDVTPVADHAAGDAWRAANEYIYDLWHNGGSVGPAPTNWWWSSNLQYNTLQTPSGAPGSSSNNYANCIFQNRSGVDANRWYSPALDTLGLDGPYNYRGSANGDGSGWLSEPGDPPLGQGLALYATPGTSYYNPASDPDGPAADPDKLRWWSDFSVSKGGPAGIIIGEFTSYILNPAGAYPPTIYAARGYDSTPQGANSSPEVAERAHWISGWAEYWANDPRMELVCWYERDSSNSSFPNGRISGGTLPAEPVSLANFAAIKGTEQVVTPASGFGAILG